MRTKVSQLFPRGPRLAGASLLAVPALIAAGIGVAAPASGSTAPAAAHGVKQINLVSDQAGKAQFMDPKLVNPWGLAQSPTSPLWAANNGSDSATLYSGGVAGSPVVKAGLEVDVAGGPTGQVFNDTTDFVVSSKAGSGAAPFIFDTEAGDIKAWNPAAAPTTALTVAHVRNAVFKGLALLKTPVGPFLLATDFHNGRIDVFNSKFHRVPLPRPFLTDPRLPRGYAPFNVAVLNNSIYVSYAKQDAMRDDEVDGPGLGFVDRYSAIGLFPHRVASRGTLNAPWGMTLAPSTFGRHAGQLLVGNFGDGRISTFDRWNNFRGLLRRANGHSVKIDGLWSLIPGTATNGGVGTVLFSAGPDDETHGLYGLLRPAD
jgi:uncharacterized protein (TIGR03118 family)